MLTNSANEYVQIKMRLISFPEAPCLDQSECAFISILFQQATASALLFITACQSALEGRAVVNLQMANTFGAFVDMNDAIKVCSLNPLRPSIKLQILLLCFHTFLTEVVGRSC